MATRATTSALLLASLMASQVALAGGPSGQAIAFTCNGCHGSDGMSKGAAPSIKGLPASYLESAMKDFKSEKRPATIMSRIAKGYSDEEITAMAVYYASMK
jgi:sulfide dehydrogenase cytochrome subunit